MTVYEELIKSLRICAIAERDYECAGCAYRDKDFDCNSVMKIDAADAIEELRYALLLMVLQYCTTDDGFLYHSFMTAGECAFAVLGLENGQHEAPLWEKIDREMQEASERAAANTAPKGE